MKFKAETSTAEKSLSAANKTAKRMKVSPPRADRGSFVRGFQEKNIKHALTSVRLQELQDDEPAEKRAGMTAGNV